MLTLPFRINSSVRSMLVVAAICVATAGLEAIGLAQTEQPAPARHASAPVHPSNPQLVSPQIEARVEQLLHQMTLEEKIG